MYTFARQLERGERAEAALDRIFAVQYQIVAATDQQQRQGLDRLFTDRVSGEQWSVQDKADWTAHRTGNAFIETISVDVNQTPGWAVTSQADQVRSYLPLDGYAYLLPMAVIRASLPIWAQWHPCRAIPNAHYATHGLLVPLWEFEKLCAEGPGTVVNGLPVLDAETGLPV